MKFGIQRTPGDKVTVEKNIHIHTPGCAFRGGGGGGIQGGCAIIRVVRYITVMIICRAGWPLTKKKKGRPPCGW